MEVTVARLGERGVVGGRLDDAKEARKAVAGERSGARPAHRRHKLRLEVEVVDGAHHCQPAKALGARRAGHIAEEDVAELALAQRLQHAHLRLGVDAKAER